MAVIELDKDNLDEHMHYKDLIVVFSSKTCGACKKIRPYLWELDEKYQVIILDVKKLVRSSKFIPGGVQHYPTIGYFHNGYFVKRLSQANIKNKTLE